jgi:hypothetical protein
MADLPPYIRILQRLQYEAQSGQEEVQEDAS